MHGGEAKHLFVKCMVARHLALGTDNNLAVQSTNKYLMIRCVSAHHEVLVTLWASCRNNNTRFVLS